MVDQLPDFDALAEASMDALRERMQDDATVVVKQLFDKINEYVDEDLAPVLATAGVSADSVRYAFLRMVLIRMFKYALTSAWGSTKREQELAMDFTTATLGHFGGALGEVVGEACRIAVVWGDDEEEERKGPRIVVPE
jgi:hypothetical protein